VAVLSKAWVYRNSLTGAACSNPAGSMECSVLSDFSSTGWSLVQRSSAKSGMSECDREEPKMRVLILLRLWRRGRKHVAGKKYTHLGFHVKCSIVLFSFNQISISPTYFHTYQISEKFHPVGTELTHADSGRTYRQTEGWTELTSKRPSSRLMQTRLKN